MGRVSRVKLLVAAAVGVGATYLPGAQPNEFAKGEKVPLKVNKLWSAKTQLTYNYYSLPVCVPAVSVAENENLGQILVGDRIMSSDYDLSFQDDSCKVLCAKHWSEKEVADVKERIDNEYMVTWYLDGLPASVRMVEEDNQERSHLERGFPLGVATVNEDTGAKDSYLFNHIIFKIEYNQEDGKEEGAADAKYRIVGFEVEPHTVKHKMKDPSKGYTTDNIACTKPDEAVEQMILRDGAKDGMDVAFTYDVHWEPVETSWASRWDKWYGDTSDDDIHWFSIINSLMIVLFLTGMIAMILMRNLYRDIARYNDDTTSEEAAEETGWKLVHGDVFRPPAGFFGPMFLSVFVGSGMQILAMSLALLFLALLGFLSPANQGAFLQTFIVLYMLMGSFAGYYSARLYKMFKGKAWKRNTFLTAFAFPAILFGISLALNIMVMTKRSSLAVPFPTYVFMFALWLFVCVPLVFLGSYFGFKKEEIRHPVRVNNIPRQIPPQPWYLHPIPSVLVGGILPFGAVFIELFFIMSAIWLAQVYYVYGFLFLVLLILCVTCAEISIVMAYFQLCSEDYNWWWRSFLTSGSSAIYLFAYAIVYFSTKLEITQPISTLFYFGYMAMAAWVFFLLTGSIGFIASFTFVSRIFGSIKVD